MVKYLSFSPEVEEAMAFARPIVALESTVIAHGLPYPQNLETARLVEEAVRENGATPATIAILKGQIRVGLSEKEIERLAEGGKVHKVSRRDLALVIAKGEDGATTVAATMYIASLAGIKVFATGGIGGVHRGQAFDISADLVELARTQVVVVCAGAKSILDLPATLEWLETHGVPILGYETWEFPAFYSRGSGLPVDLRVGSPQEVAEIVRASRELGLKGGLLVAVPVPAEEELPLQVMEEAIVQALREAEERSIKGKALTPFLLRRVNELTGGKALRANTALLKNNAAIAARIAMALNAFEEK